MSLKRYAAMLLAALVVTAGTAGAVAAAPGSGNAPDDAGPNENANDAATDDADGDSAESTDNADASDEGNASAADEQRGPPADMPEQVPDHVGEIHSLINQFIDGSVSDLGSAVSDVTPDDENDATDDGDASSAGSATETPA